MTAWARLTWQAADPAALATDLGRRLGVRAAAASRPHGAWRLRLGADTLELVPWRREAADDEPGPGGRLVFEPLEPEPDGVACPDDHGPDDRGPEESVPEEPGPDGAGASDATAGLRLAGVCWATVELDRAEAELGPWLVPDGPRRAERDEPHLGARTRSRRSAGLPGDVLVLAEPRAEGRLAASLARDGEGPCALYLAPGVGLERWRAAATPRGVRMSAVRTGPLGPSILLAGPVSGPHLVIVTRPETGRTSLSRRGGTIAP